MKLNFKVKMKVTIEFLVEIYFRNDLHFFEKYFTWGNIQPNRDFLDILYIYIDDAALRHFTPLTWTLTNVGDCEYGASQDA